MMTHLKRLSLIFCRPINGVHNRTWGPIFDMMSPMVNSIFSTSTSTSMALHAELRDAIMSPTCTKVIVLAHGTGAAILSDVLDRMHCDMPMEMMSKMEVYTFGSAARHLSNPCILDERQNTSLPTKNGITDMLRNEECERVIPVCLFAPAIYLELTPFSGLNTMLWPMTSSPELESCTTPSMSSTTVSAAAPLSCRVPASFSPNT
jgi:hypothetical protein